MSSLRFLVVASLVSLAALNIDADVQAFFTRGQPATSERIDVPVLTRDLRLLTTYRDATDLYVTRPIKSGAGKCLDVHAPDQRLNGAKVQVWDCNGSVQQRWWFQAGTIRSGVGKCLDVHAPDQQINGAKVQVWDCNRSIQQTWTTHGRTLRSGAGKCLDVHAPDQRTNGAKVQVWDCNGTIQQRWSWSS